MMFKVSSWSSHQTWREDFVITPREVVAAVVVNQQQQEDKYKDTASERMSTLHLKQAQNSIPLRVIEMYRRAVKVLMETNRRGDTSWSRSTMLQ